MTTVNQSTQQSVQEAASIYALHIHLPMTIGELAKKVQLSEAKFKKAFKEVYGMAPYSYLISVRMEKAKTLLLQGKSIKSISFLLGYKTESNFCKAFRKSFHTSPREWKIAQIKNSLIADPASHHLDRVQSAVTIIDQSIQQHHTIKSLALQIKLPEKLLKHLFKQQYGMGVYTYLTNKRMEKAKEMLLAGVTYKTIMPAIGYKKESVFCRAFKKIYHETPSEWKEKILTTRIHTLNPSLTKTPICTNEKPVALFQHSNLPIDET